MAPIDALPAARWQYDPNQPHLSAYATALSNETVTPDLTSSLTTIGEHQRRLRAQRRRGLLLVLHGLDASGKDSLIRVLARYMDPAAFHAWSFGRPIGTETQHDFLWRITPWLPAYGDVAAFNRGHHEVVIAERAWPVHTADHYDWPTRYAALRHFEAHLAQEGTRILKFWLHLSQEEHRQRLLKRLDRPHKRWKFDAADIDAWDRRSELLGYVEDALTATHIPEAPWFVIPADHKPTARAVVAAIVAQELETLAPDYPTADDQILTSYRERLTE